MNRKLYCECCYSKDKESDPKIYSEGERCPECNAFLIPYLGFSRSNKPAGKKAPARFDPSIYPSQISNEPKTNKQANPANPAPQVVAPKPVVQKTAAPKKDVPAQTQKIVAPKKEAPATVQRTPSTVQNSYSIPQKTQSAVQPVQTVKTTANTPALGVKKSVVEDIFDRKHLIGMKSVRVLLEKYYSEWSDASFKDALYGKAKEDRTISKMSFLVCGDELAGKTEISLIVTEMLNIAGLRNNASPESIRLKDFEALLNDDKSLKNFIKDYKGKTVLIEDHLDEAFMNNDGEISVDANKLNDLLHVIKKINGELTVIFELSYELREQMRLLSTRVDDLFYQIPIDKYSNDELLALTKKRIVDEQKYPMSEDAIEQLKNRIKRTSFEEYSQGRFVADVYREAIDKLEERVSKNNSISKEDRFTIIKSDIQIKVFDKEKADEIKAKIDSKTGQEQIKAYAQKIYKRASDNEDRIRNGKTPIKIDQPNFVLEGEAGVGKTTSCYLLAELLKACGVLSSDEPYIVSIADLQDPSVGATPDKVKQVIAKAKGRLLVIDEAYTLAPAGNGISGNYGQEIVDTLTNELGKPGKDVVVVLIGYPNTIDPVIKMNKGMNRRFPNKIMIDDYSVDEMVNIFKYHLKENGFELENDSESLVYTLLDMRRKSENFGNAGGVITICEELMDSASCDSDIITKDDLLNAINSSSGGKVTEVIKELSDMIGINVVKKMINEMVEGINGRSKQKAAGINVMDPTSYNMIFAGPPGTGKTTVCRLIARLFSELGLLKYSDKIKEIDGKDLIAGFVGQTEERVNKTINEAVGGILYIDEVYQMDNGTDFGQSAINALCKGIDARGNDLIVIASGYADKVDDFLCKNSGLKSRFPTYVKFNPYTKEELVSIFEQFVHKNDIKCDDSREFREKLSDWIDVNMSDPDFGNGRSMRNLAEKSIRNLQARIGRDENFPLEGMNVIKAEDIPDVA